MKSNTSQCRQLCLLQIQLQLQVWQGLPQDVNGAFLLPDSRKVTQIQILKVPINI